MYGANNRFGHPSEVTLANLKERGCQIYRTDQHGEIQIRIDPKGEMQVKTMRSTE